MTATNETVDVAIVGGGACGTMTALRAARNQDLVIAVFEKSTREGCNAGISSGSLAAGGTRFQRAAGIVDSPERHAEEILAASGDDEARDIVLALCRAAPRYVEWIADELGYPMEIGLDMPRAGMSVPRLHTDEGREGGRYLMSRLRRALDECANVAVMDEAPVVDLVGGPAGVTGVVVRQNGGSSTVTARHVVLACDGFAASADLMRRYGAHLGEPLYGGVSTSTGDALPWLERLGARTRNMGAYLGHGLMVVGHGTRLNPALPFMGAALLDDNGDRFVEESSLGYSALGDLLRRRPGERAVLAWDEPAMVATAKSELMRESARAGAYRRFAGTGELARAFGMRPDSVESSLKVVTGERGVQPPLYAARVTHGVLTSQGGAVVDTEGRVLNGDGAPIPGLRAGGGTAAGLAGPSSAGYSSGSGLLSAFGMGWIIGDAIARRPGDQ